MVALVEFTSHVVELLGSAPGSQAMPIASMKCGGASAF